MSINPNEKIVIVGAGPVGAMTALFMARRGFNVVLIESRVDLRKHDISAGRSINLALANRGIRPLQALGLMNQVQAMMLPMRGRMVHDIEGNTSFQAYGQRDDEVIYSISRGGLNALLLDHAERTDKVDILFNRPCHLIDLDNKYLEVRNLDNDQIERIEFDRIIGADGANSQVRKAILAKGASVDSIEPLGHAYKELHIPADEKGDFQIDKQALHIWPRGGFMLIALPNLDGSFTLTLFLPAQGKQSFEQLQSSQAVETFFQTYFADAMALIPNLVENFFTNPVGKLATVRCAPWHYQDCAVLLGDAAHAIVPFHGQGMNCGFEDSLTFDQCLQNHQDWQSLFEEYELQRLPNGNAIADMALDNYIEMRDSVRQPAFLLKKQLGFELEKRFPGVFIPRYSMVMFNDMPYAEAQRLGEINNLILEQLSEGKSDLSEIDWQHAEKLVEQYLGD